MFVFKSSEMQFPTFSREQLQIQSMENWVFCKLSVYVTIIMVATTLFINFFQSKFFDLSSVF